MAEEKKDGLKFQVRDGATGEIISGTDQPTEKVKKEEESKDAITNTKSGISRKK